MTSYRSKLFLPQILVILLVALGLLSAGVRVPDLSRPHRPKPTHRLLIETKQKTCASPLKQHDDSVTVYHTLPASRTTVPYHAESLVVSPRYAFLPFSPNSGRSPPASHA